MKTFLKSTISVASIGFVLILVLRAAEVQASDDVKQFRKDGLTFEYLTDWTLEDDSNSDAQQFTLWHRDSRAEIRVFVQRRRIEPEKMPKAHKSFVEPYVTSTAKQFIAMGAKPERSADKTDIGTTTAEGVTIKAVLGGEPGAARIYWALIGQRVVVLTFFGPDKELEKFVAAWDRVRTTLQVEAKK